MKNKSSHFREKYREIAEKNVLLSKSLLSDFYDLTWELARFSSARVDKCLQASEIAEDEKRLPLLIMLRNCVSDLCCCLDSLERGHERTVMNNLRMVFEDFSCVVDMHNDESVFQDFLNDKHQASKSIGNAKKIRPDDLKFEFLYGELSKISHHKNHALIARQMQTRDGLLSHLKLINPQNIDIQTTPIFLIIDFLLSIAEVVMEIGQPVLTEPDFWSDPFLEAEDISGRLQKLTSKSQSNVCENIVAN